MATSGENIGRCPNGHELPTGSRFCPECGSEIPESTCPNGHLVQSGDAFCGVCGLSLAKESDPLASVTSQRVVYGP